jgi:hypothetical protein
VKRLIGLGLAILLTISACRPAATPSSEITAPQASVSASPTVAQALSPTATREPTLAPPTASQTQPPASQSSTPTIVLSPTLSSTSTPAQPSHQGQAIIVDHTSVELFDQIPEDYLAKARALRLMYADASVGFNISEGLNCLAARSWAAAPAACRNAYIDQDGNWKTFNQADFQAGRVPAGILFTPDPVKYDRSNWIFEGLPGNWPDITRDFINNLAPAYLDKADVLSYQFNYFHVADFSEIADPEKGFFTDQPGRYDFKDLEAFIAQHPDKTFFYWTTSLARNTGSQVALDFNNQMRQYVKDNGLILFDVADIESHTDQGTPCYDSRDAVEYCSRRADGATIKCENEPDDGLELPAICQDYTTEPDAGHLGSVSAGAIRLAKAYWVLMARIAGWQP